MYREVKLLAQGAVVPGLAQNRYFDDPAFLKYLAYLQYWKQPQYARFVMYGLLSYAVSPCSEYGAAAPLTVSSCAATRMHCSSWTWCRALTSAQQ